MKPLLRKFLVFLLILTLASTSLIAQRDGLEQALLTKLQSTTYHALLIGINDYGDTSGIDDLVHPVSDAKKFASLLTRKYHFDSNDIKLLPNSKRSEIIKQLELLAKRVKPEDNVVIFYAGHGKMDEAIDQGYWLPADAEIDTRGNWISNDDIRDYIKKIPSKHTLLISDACFSGSLLRTAEESREILELYNDVARRVLTSGNLETVPDKSVFLKYLMQELDENEKPFISASGLYQGYRRAVIYNSPNNQMPLYGPINGAGDEGGDFIFLRGNISSSISSQPTSTVVPSGPSLGISESTKDYGSIELTTEDGGALYLDGKFMGNVNANSRTPINQVTPGYHTINIVGSEIHNLRLNVYKGRRTKIIFKKGNFETIYSKGITFIDIRDQKTYYLVEIGNQIWMAENLDYKLAGSFVNRNGVRLYSWEEAMKACPVGWHLPSDEEWDILVNRFGGEDKAGEALKSGRWHSGGGGSNSSGFNGQPVRRFKAGSLHFEGREIQYWTSAISDSTYSKVKKLSYDNTAVQTHSVNITELGSDYPCRCIRDDIIGKSER